MAKAIFPLEVELNGNKYRIIDFTEVVGMSINGNGKPEVDKLCRAEWLSPYVGWRKLRNVNILAMLRKETERILKEREHNA